MSLCLAAGCWSTRTHINRPFCPKCWKRLPPQIRHRLLRPFRIGQFETRNPIKPWQQAFDDAHRFLETSR